MDRLVPLVLLVVPVYSVLQVRQGPRAARDRRALRVYRGLLEASGLRVRLDQRAR